MPAKKDTIFISHASADRDLSNAVDDIIRASGKNTIIYERDFCETDADFVAKITDASLDATVTICLLSAAYLSSNWCVKEYEIARQQGKCLPAMVEDCDTFNIHTPTEAIDVSQQDTISAARTIVAALFAFLRKCHSKQAKRTEVFDYVEKTVIQIPAFGDDPTSRYWQAHVSSYLQDQFIDNNVVIEKLERAVRTKEEALQIQQRNNADIVLYGTLHGDSIEMNYVTSRGWELPSNSSELCLPTKNMFRLPFSPIKRAKTEYPELLYILKMAFGKLEEARNRKQSARNQYDHATGMLTPEERRKTGVTLMPGFGIFLRLNDINSEPKTELGNLKVGDSIFVYFHIVNGIEDNTIDKVQCYAPFGHKGIQKAWLRIGEIQRFSSHTPAHYSIPNNAHLEYVRNSTITSTNVSGEWVYSNVVDNDKSGESKVFSDDKFENGYSWKNIRGGKLPDGKPFQYTARYKLEVVTENKAIFNKHPHDQFTLQARKVGDNKWHTTLNELKQDDILEFELYVHNNTRGTLAMNTRTGIANWPVGAIPQHIITGFASADNAERATGHVALNGNQPLILEYLNGSTRFQGCPTGDVAPFDINLPQTDGVINNGGVMIGTQGAMEGCWDYLMTVRFRARVR